MVTALLAILPLAFIQIPQPARLERGQAQRQAQTSVWQDFQAGIRYVIGWPGLLFIGLMAVVINFVFTPAYSLLPLLVKDYFGSDAVQLGWVELLRARLHHHSVGEQSRSRIHFHPQELQSVVVAQYAAYRSNGLCRQGWERIF